MQIKNSPNQNDRKGYEKPVMLILHYTGTKSAAEADQVYMTPEQVAPHYMIDKDGSITKYMEETARAWHAGQSSWDGIKDINSASIGIEVVNGGHEFGLEEFPEIQIQKLIELVTDIRSRHDIPDHYILGHSDIAPGRKADPGEKFPWGRLHQAGIGLIPQLGASSGQVDTTVELFASLREFGYDYTDDFDLIRREFVRHYLPDLFGQTIDDEILCKAIYSLSFQKNLTKTA